MSNYCCEKCWGDAFTKSYGGNGDQVDWYLKLLKERKDKPCTPKEQAGDYWDEDKQMDSRDINDQ